MSVYVFLVLFPNKGFRAKNNAKLRFSHFTCLAGGAGCVDAGLALSKAKKDDNDNDFDDSDGGTCPDAIGQNSVSLTSRPFVGTALIFVSFLGLPLGFVV